MSAPHESEKSTLPEYRERIIQHVWSIPSVHNITSNLARGIVVMLMLEPYKDTKKEKLRAYRVDEEYNLTMLADAQLEKVMFVWNATRKLEDVRIVCIASGRAMSERSLRKALFEANLLGGKDQWEAKHRAYAESGKSDRRQFFDLEDKVPFGKYGPNGAASNNGQALTIKEVIDKSPGWITWAMQEVSKDFLNAPAMKYYQDRVAKRKPRYRKNV